MTTKRLVVVLVCVTGLKLALSAGWGWTNDIPQTRDEAEWFLTGRSAPIFPLGYYVLACGSLLASRWTGWPYEFWIKVPAILADAAIASVLNAASRGGARAALLYLLNPVTVLLSVYHGQLHTAATAAAVLAAWAAERGRDGLSGAALGLAASVRHHFALLIAPWLLRPGVRRVAMACAFAAVTVLANAALLGGYGHRITAPIWVYGAWGYTMVLQQGPRVLELFGVRGLSSMMDGVNAAVRSAGPAIYWAWALVFLAWVWRRHQRQALADPWRAALFFLVGQYAISPGFGVQWLIWALPFWLIVDLPGAVRYSALAGSFLAGSYWQASLNAKYGVASITANLPMLSVPDLAGVALVGIADLMTWGWCVRTVWRLART